MWRKVAWARRGGFSSGSKSVATAAATATAKAKAPVQEHTNRLMPIFLVTSDLKNVIDTSNAWSFWAENEFVLT